MGEAAKPAVPLLVQMHASENETIKRASATALWKIDPAAAKQAGAEEPTEEDEE